MRKTPNLRKISAEELATQLVLDDAEDAAANARRKVRIIDPEWRAQFLRLRPDPCESDLPLMTS